jgi:hypothetical protein
MTRQRMPTKRDELRSTRPPKPMTPIETYLENIRSLVHEAHVEQASPLLARALERIDDVLRRLAEERGGRK